MEHGPATLFVLILAALQSADRSKVPAYRFQRFPTKSFFDSFTFPDEKTAI
jgi:hypothetical protein